jgi:purine-binding chemotaxis protein CheW
MATVTEPTRPAALVPSEEHVVIFQLANERYAIDIRAVQEIVRMQTITPVPEAANWVEGVTNLRGRVVPVLDLRRRCGVPSAEHTPDTRIMVVCVEDGLVGLIVDGVSEVFRIPGAQIEEPGKLVRMAGNGYLRGIAKLENGLVSLLALDGLIPADVLVREEALEAA